MRITTAGTFRRVLAGLKLNQQFSLRAQEQLATGRRILRPSDDPTGAANAIRLTRQLEDVTRFKDAIGESRRHLDSASGALEETSRLMSDARELMIQAMNGTLNEADRKSIAAEIALLREQLLEQANRRSGDNYVLGGSSTILAPWEEVTEGGRTVVRYRGDEDEVSARIGLEITAEITLAGSEIFGRFEPTGTLYGGRTGAAAGLTVDEGTGFIHPEFRHDSTAPGTLGTVGLALVNGGDDDTILGDNTLTIDVSGGWIQLGSGERLDLPATPDPDFVVTNELGGELHLDFSAWTGTDYTGTVSAAGSVTLDGTNYTSLTFAETDLELIDDATGRTIHVNTTGVKRAGVEQVSFAGTTNLFDLLGAVAADLENEEGNAYSVVANRLGAHLVEFDRHHDNILHAAGVLGSRSHSMSSAERRVLDMEVQLQGALGDVADADLAQVAAELTQSEYLLQIAQASGARVLQTSLLSFLG